MSSSRSIAAARQRRGVESAPPIKTNNYVSTNKDNMNNNSQGRVNYRTTKSNIYQDNNQPINANNNINNINQISKLSISDAFSLVTLRLGRVELIMNKLQSDGILDANHNINNEKINSGSNNFDDTILQNIITRLDGLDKKTVSNELNQKLQSQYNHLQEELKQTKDMVLKLQSFIMDTSQKLNNFIANQESINANQDSINEEFFDLRDSIDMSNNANVDMNASIDKLNENVVTDIDSAIKYNIDSITNESINIPLENTNLVVENTIESVESIESIKQEEIKETVAASTEITSEIVENTSRKNKHNRNKSINLEV